MITTTSKSIFVKIILCNIAIFILYFESIFAWLGTQVKLKYFVQHCHIDFVFRTYFCLVRQSFTRETLPNRAKNVRNAKLKKEMIITIYDKAISNRSVSRIQTSNIMCQRSILNLNFKRKMYARHLSNDQGFSNCWKIFNSKEMQIWQNKECWCRNLDRFNLFKPHWYYWK